MAALPVAAAIVLIGLPGHAQAQSATSALSGFTVGDLVLSVYGQGSAADIASGTTYTDNQASPITLLEVTTGGAAVGQMVLPQTANGANFAVSGEYGSSSEGSLSLSADGHSLAIMGYGVNAATYNAGGAAVYGNAALAQSTSVPGGSFTPVARVVADISANGTVDSSTALYNVANTNNPRSVATVNGSAFYVSGQGVSGDTTEGVLLAQDGASSATPITTATDTRNVAIYNDQLFVSTDTKAGTGQFANISSLGTAGNLPTGATTPSILPGISTGSKKSATPGGITLSAGQGNSINLSSGTIQLSPENFFFANSTTLYVADSGNPKAGGVGNGGLQKWSLVGGIWTLDYTLSAGLNLVSNSAASGTTGLIGLTGEVVGDSVELFATNATIGDLDPTYLFGITDNLDSMTNQDGSFTTLVTAAPDTNIRGVAFAPSPVPEPSTISVMAMGLLSLGFIARRRRS